MPCTYDIFPDLNVVRVIFRGHVHTRDILALLDSLDGDPLYHRSIDELIYLEGCSDDAFTPAKRRDLANLIRGLFLMNGRSKRLALVAPDEPGRSFARTFAEVMHNNAAITVRIFETAAGAMAFLEQTDPRLRLPVDADCFGRA